jgi:membrane associated rhomboid family serine protease
LLPVKDNIPTLRFPVVTVALIAANVVVYLLLQGGRLGLPDQGGEWPVQTYALIPCEVTAECPAAGSPAPLVTIFTSMFMHGSIVHLAGNMLFLWIFGNTVEDSMGRVRFLAFYLLAGVAAAALQIGIDPDSAVAIVGASGAVAGVLGGYVVLFRRSRVVTVILIVFFFTIVELPTLLILGFWIVMQVAFGYFDLDTAGAEGGAVYVAPVGGFAFGLLAIRLFADERRRRQQTELVGRVT